MDMTIGQLKVGTPLSLGRYSVSIDARPAPITWLKATPNGDFITQCAVDFLCLDARERNSDAASFRNWGNPSHKHSNLYSFLNSDSEHWYAPTHEHDAPPNTQNGVGRHSTYSEHQGFPYFFQDCEIASILHTTKEVNGEVITSQIRLPSYGELVGDSRLPLFKKKGVRAKCTEDLLQNKGAYTGFDYNSFAGFWLTDPGRAAGQASILSRSACKESEFPCANAGVRPMCTLSPDTVVILGDDGMYHIKLWEVRQNVCTDEELFEFLGVVRP